MVLAIFGYNHKLRLNERDTSSKHTKKITTRTKKRDVEKRNESSNNQTKQSYIEVSKEINETPKKRAETRQAQIPSSVAPHARQNLRNEMEIEMNSWQLKRIAVTLKGKWNET